MQYLFVFEDWLVKAEKIALATLVFIMVALSFLQVIMRLAFSSGILWADPLLRHFVLWAGFFGAGLAAKESRHFSLDIAPKFMPEKYRRPVELITRIFTCAVCLLLLAAAVKFLKDESAGKVILFSIGRTQIPALWLEFMIPAGFALVIFHTAAGIFRKPIQ